MNDILKEIFESFAEASRIGQRIQIAADAAMRGEREEAERLLAEPKWNDISKGETSFCTACAAQRGETLCTKCQQAIDEAEASRADNQPWNDALNPQ